MIVVCELPIDANGPLAVRTLLDALATVWARSLSVTPLPSLYSSGVQYRPEPNRGQYEEFAPPYKTFERGWGDCDDLVLYRIAELRAAGEKATVQVMSQELQTGKRMHVRVHRANGTIEDPSLILYPRKKKVAT